MGLKSKKYFVNNEAGLCRLCTQADDSESKMVQCEECDRWFHLACAKLNTKPTNGEEYICIKCKDFSQDMPLPKDHNSVVSALIEALKQNRVNDNMFYKRTTLRELPYFDGRAKDWPKFKKAFDETSEEAGFSNLENLNRLQTYLKGDAERSVRSLFLDPVNVNMIIKRLEELYGRPEIVYQELLNDVTNIRVENNKIPELSEALENLVTNILVMKKKEYLYDHRLIDDLVGKMPFHLQSNWIVYKSNIQKDEIVTLAHLSNWLIPIASTIRQLPKQHNHLDYSATLHIPSKGNDTFFDDMIFCHKGSLNPEPIKDRPEHSNSLSRFINDNSLVENSSSRTNDHSEILGFLGAITSQNNISSHEPKEEENEIINRLPHKRKRLKPPKKKVKEKRKDKSVTMSTETALECADRKENQMQTQGNKNKENHERTITVNRSEQEIENLLEPIHIFGLKKAIEVKIEILDKGISFDISNEVRTVSETSIGKTFIDHDHENILMGIEQNELTNFNVQEITKTELEKYNEIKEVSKLEINNQELDKDNDKAQHSRKDVNKLDMTMITSLNNLNKQVLRGLKIKLGFYEKDNYNAGRTYLKMKLSTQEPIKANTRYDLKKWSYYWKEFKIFLIEMQSVAKVVNINERIKKYLPKESQEKEHTLKIRKLGINETLAKTEVQNNLCKRLIGYYVHLLLWISSILATYATLTKAHGENRLQLPYERGKLFSHLGKILEPRRHHPRRIATDVVSKASIIYKHLLIVI